MPSPPHEKYASEHSSDSLIKPCTIPFDGSRYWDESGTSYTSVEFLDGRCSSWMRHIQTSPTSRFIFKHAEMGSCGNFPRSQVVDLEETGGTTAQPYVLVLKIGSLILGYDGRNCAAHIKAVFHPRLLLARHIPHSCHYSRTPLHVQTSQLLQQVFAN
jgi:hypothetical protein